MKTAPGSIQPLVLVSALVCGLAWAPAPARAQGGPPGAGVSGFLSVDSIPETVFVATDAGVFRTDNAGLSWAAANEGLAVSNVSDVAGSPSLLFAATAGVGVFRSRDGGASWEPVNEGLQNPAILSLAVDPSDPNTVYAGTSNGGIFKTTTAGDSWSAVNTGLSEGNYLDIAIDPANPNVIYAANSSLLAPGNGVLFKTENAGAQWTAVGFGFAPLSLAIDPGNPAVVYIGTTNGISKTSNAGGSLDFNRLLGASVTGIAVDPDNPSTVYAASRFNGVFKSTDGGLNWQAASSGLPFTELFALAIDPSSPSRLFLGSDGLGVLRSTDGAETWQLSSGGIGGADVRAVAVDPRDSTTVLASVTGGGLFRSNSGGASWEESRQGLQANQVRAIAFDPSNPSTVYAGSVNPFVTGDGALFKSTNAGAQWQLIATGIAVFSIAVDSVNTRTVYIGTNIGVFKSTNGGDDFEPVNDVKGNQDDLSFWNILHLTIDPSNRQTLYVAALSNFDLATGQIFKTRDGGDEWEGAGVTSALLAVTVDPADRNRVYVGSITAGIFRSTDGGNQYRRAIAGLPDDGAVSVASIAVDSRDNSSVYAATSAGVYRSTNRGDSWFEANSGLESAQLRRLAVDPNNARVVYAATANGGIFKTVDGGESWQPTGNFVGSSPIISRASIVSAAAFHAGGVSPGEIVAIFGLNIGPPRGVTPGFDAVGKVPTEAEGVTVFFGDHPAPLFFVRGDQINAQVPFEIAGVETVAVQVQAGDQSSNTATVRVAASHPGIFNAVLNQDLSRNSAESPEAAGRLVVLFATGHGLLDQPVMTGEPASFSPPFPSPLLPVSLTIGGQPAALSFVGLAPGFAGLLQMNAQIPPGLSAGEAEAVLRVGDTASEGTVIIFVR